MSIEMTDVPTPPVMAMRLRRRLRFSVMVTVVGEMLLAIGMIVAVICVGFSCEVTANKECEAESRNERSRRHPQARVESFWQDPLRRIERDEAERVHRNRM